ncbi:23810_t:CDS:2, partial [Dentiscutata erythropus]
TFEPFFTHNGHLAFTIMKPQTNSPNLSPTCNQTTTNPPPAKKYKKNTNDKDDIQMDYSLATFSTTASSLQLQKNRAEDPALITMGKTADLPTPITKTNNKPDLIQVNTTTDLQTQDHLGPPITPQTNDIIMTKSNLLTIDNIAQLSDHTYKALHNQSMDTQSNTTIKSSPPKFYARALADNNQPKPKRKFAGHRDLAWCTTILTDLALQ